MERHDDSPDPVHDRIESVSDTSQYVAADGGAVRNISFSASRTVSKLSSPSLDDEGGNQTPFSPTAQGQRASSSTSDSPSSLLSPLRSAPSVRLAANNRVAVPVPTLDGKFSCPKCPRTFSEFAKARFESLSDFPISQSLLTEISRHTRSYQHTHVCPVAGCRWSYHLPKDLSRHSITHNPNAPRHNCPYPRCQARNSGAGTSFSRQDLLKRHIESVH